MIARLRWPSGTLFAHPGFAPPTEPVVSGPLPESVLLLVDLLSECASFRSGDSFSSSRVLRSCFSHRTIQAPSSPRAPRCHRSLRLLLAFWIFVPPLTRFPTPGQVFSSFQPGPPEPSAPRPASRRCGRDPSLALVLSQGS